MKKFLFCSFLFLSIISNGQQSNYRFDHVDVADGLSHPEITAIHEDSRGYLWIGTRDGLNKYNGNENVIYKPTKDNSNSISNEFVKSIVEDQNGNLWFGTRNGLSLYIQEADHFVNFTKVGDCDNCLAGIIITDLLVKGDKIWIGTNAGLSVIDINTYAIDSWWYDENTDVVEEIYAIRNLISTSDNRIVMSTDSGLVIYDPSQEKFKCFGEKDGLTTKGLGYVFQDAFGKYWLASDKDGVYHIEGDLDAPKFIHHPELIPDKKKKTTVYAFLERENGELWIATHLGLTILNQITKEISHLFHAVDDDNSISHNTIKEMYHGSNGRIWIGSPSGLDFFDPYYNQFEFISHHKDDPNSIGGTSVTAIFEDSRGFIWIGTQDAGISILKKNNKGEEKYFHIKKGNSSRDLKGNEIYAFEEDKLGRIWVSIPQGLHIIDWPDRSRFDYKIEVVEVGEIVENKLPTPYIYQFLNDKQNTMWLATHGEGLISLDSNGLFRQYKYIDQNPLYTSVEFIITISKDNDGRIWLGNLNLCGGVINDPETEKSYTRMKGDSALFRKNINDFLFVENGVVVSTNSGLYHYDSREELLGESNPKFTSYTELNGLSNDFGNELISQDDELVWVSTSDGISRIDLKKKTAKSYKNTLSSSKRHFNHNAGTMVSDSMIYFGGAKGVVRFNPYKIQQNKERPRVYFKNFKILNEKIPVGSDSLKLKRSIPVETSFLDQVILDSKDKIFSLEIDVVNFRPGSNMVLQYKLDGFDEVWQSTDNKLITRSNLDAGKYTLKARASNTDGIWSDEAEIDIIVYGPWWKRPWAFVLYGLLLFGLFQFLLRFRLQRERLVAKIKLKEREKFRKESSKDFHDEAGTKITRISLLTEILKKRVEGNEDANQILFKIDQNLKELNIGMRDFIWGLNVDNDNLLETLFRFTEFAHMFCEEANIKFKSQPIDSELSTVKLEMDQRRHFLLILKEALNNSVRHGKPSDIYFNCVYKNDKVLIGLIDNGRGFEMDSVKYGNGIENMKFRAKEIGAELSLVSNPENGTEVNIEFDVPMKSR